MSALYHMINVGTLFSEQLIHLAFRLLSH